MLRLAPDAFWSLTPRELAAVLAAARPPAARPDRPALEALMRAFPDTSTGRPA